MSRAAGVVTAATERSILFREERLRHGVLVLPDLDPAGRVAEDQSVPLGPGEQGPQSDKLIESLTAVHRLQVGEDVVMCHFPQVVVVVRPLQQDRK